MNVQLRSFEEFMKASCISIGDEILIGQVVDTNSSWIATQLNLIGIEVIQIRVCSDLESEIHRTLKECEKVSDIIIVTGGLGPTRDDITREAIAHYFNQSLRIDEKALENIRDLLTSRGIPVGVHNEKQAHLPDNSRTIPNIKGTAPGMWIEENGKILVSLPGVPFEMMAMMESFVIPELKRIQGLSSILHKTLTVVNIPESVLSTQLEAFEDALPAFLKLAYLPNLNVVRLRLSGSHTNAGLLESEMDKHLHELKRILGTQLSTSENESPAEHIGSMLKSKHLTIGTAESCTGGLLANMIASVPGSSAYFEGSVVSYSYRVKENLLGVPPEIMESKGAVSREVVEHMAESLHHLLKTDISISISGIAGPDGGTPSKPVGTVWICARYENHNHSRLFHFRGNRKQIMERTCNTALEITRCLLEGIEIPKGIYPENLQGN